MADEEKRGGVGTGGERAALAAGRDAGSSRVDEVASSAAFEGEGGADTVRHCGETPDDSHAHPTQSATNSVSRGGKNARDGGCSSAAVRGGKLKVKHVRGTVAALLALAVVVGIVGNLGWGTLSAFGSNEVFLLCPLGALEAMIGSHSVAVHALIALAVVLVIVLLSGKAFCSWACPVGFISRFLQGKKARERNRDEQAASAAGALASFRAGCASCGGCAAGGKRVERRGKLDGRHVVLAGALGTTLLFGFPVFCIVCPVGLTFATVVAFVRFIGFNEPSLGLVLFPAILVVELVVLRGWCHTLCPMGALMSLVANGNRTLRPRADVAKCRRGGEGEGSCNVCASVCPELIDPRANLGARPLVGCTRCGRCVDACPSGALSFLPQRKGDKQEQ